MAGEDGWTVRAVGHVASPLSDPRAAPRQGDEGAPRAWITLTVQAAPAAADIRVGDRLIVLTWLHLADRTVLAVHPRDDETVPLTGVFSTRSQHRPNPIGVHPVTVVAAEPGRLCVQPLEAVDGTPVLDLKVALGPAT